jgi:hypothetical protein
MANLKNITELPVAESADGLNLIVNDNGAAKQIAASAVGAQADFSVTDENSPAFIKNKPVEEWDLDITCDITWNPENSNFNEPMFTLNAGTFEDAKNKVSNGVPKIKMRINTRLSENAEFITEYSECYAMYAPEGVLGDNPEFIGIRAYWMLEDNYLTPMLLPDNTISIA